MIEIIEVPNAYFILYFKKTKTHRRTPPPNPTTKNPKQTSKKTNLIFLTEYDNSLSHICSEKQFKSP